MVMRIEKFLGFRLEGLTNNDVGGHLPPITCPYLPWTKLADTGIKALALLK